MSLPTCQQRTLDHIKGTLRANEPRLASMYAIFGRLNAGEPVGAERLARKRLRWLQAGTTMYTIVLVPIMFAAIIIGTLLGGSRSATACETGYSINNVSPLNSRPSCPMSNKTVKIAVRKTISATAQLACTAGQAARFTTVTGNEQPVPPVARPHATAAGPPKACSE